METSLNNIIYTNLIHKSIKYYEIENKSNTKSANHQYTIKPFHILFPHQWELINEITAKITKVVIQQDKAVFVYCGEHRIDITDDVFNLIDANVTMKVDDFIEMRILLDSVIKRLENSIGDESIITKIKKCRELLLDFKS